MNLSAPLTHEQQKQADDMHCVYYYSLYAYPPLRLSV